MKFRTAIVFSLLSCALSHSDAQTYPASNFTLVGHIDPETGTNSYGDKYSACWGWYQAAKQKEYAIACAQAGTYWIDVTVPSTPTVCAYRAGEHSAATWREAKTYLNYCYVISDDPGNNSFQIFDIQYLPDSVHKVYDGKDLFQRAHTLWVDGDKLYVASVTHSTSTYDNMNVYSLATPTAPVLIRSLKQDYSFISQVHDMHVRNDTIFASCAYQGLYIFRLTAANTFTQLGSLTSYTASGYNHSSALTPNGKILVFADEVPNGLPLKIADVTNLANIQVLKTINQYSATTPHNPFVVSNQYCFVAAYEDGLQLFDISNPSSPFLAGYFDTYPQGGGNVGSWPNAYNGQWGCYPFFPSKNIFALDQSNGIFMLKTHLYVNLPPNPVGISVPDERTKLDLFPNPAKDNLSFNIPAAGYRGDFDIQLISSDGRILRNYSDETLEKTGTYTRKIRLGGLSEGIYFLRMTRNGENLAESEFVISN
jgi:choice-of-anchor B domain-containing protein